MIDPKLNELPVEGLTRRPNPERSSLDDEQQTDLQRRGREGLSINDTIATGANMSVGSRGVATSGTEAGAGAGAGMTLSTPVTSGDSPAPTIVSGARGSGTTALGSSNQQPEASTRPSPVDVASGDVTDDEIAARAYRSWCDRGRPHGSPEVDWNQAAEELRRERSRKTRAASV